ncbi:DUF6332 family protein [Streptomyces sp. WMMC940]|uniref:DUF6332 family protein n=1 Tax=Streptomyces sp. WMMC940 TaxID=3015153 RepID=UPI0022B72C24|nr:DUF6332 family protein [Streptomyces sp. WMMC940]MCZ7461732.1 DUF6332 family protein [Streptomyces sp. WMMC940]
MGERTQAQRDEMTVEIGYALFSAAFAAAAVFGAIAGPKLIFAMPYAVERGLLLAAVAAAALVFPLRVVTVLRRFSREAGRRDSPDRTGRPGRPIRSDRTESAGDR